MCAVPCDVPVVHVGSYVVAVLLLLGAPACGHGCSGFAETRNATANFEQLLISRLVLL